MMLACTTQKTLIIDVLSRLKKGERCNQVLGLSRRGFLLSRMDERSRKILGGFKRLYPADVVSLLALRKNGWKGRKPLGKVGPLANVLEEGSRFLDRKLTVFHFGSRPGEGRRAMDSLLQRYQGLEDVGIRSVQDELWGPENNQALFKINAAKPDLLIVSLPSPLLEEWIHAHTTIIDVGVVWGVPR